MTYEQQIERVYKRSTEADRAAGQEWYPNALAMAEKIATDAKIGAGVIAAFSPSMGWSQNLKLANHCLYNHQFTGHTTVCNRKAERIAKGESPEAVLRGAKTEAFYQCIVTGGKTDAVCIDRHAIAICLGRPATEAERRIGTTKSGRLAYDAYAQAYRNVAKKVGLLPTELQAVTWLTWRREKGITA